MVKPSLSKCLVWCDANFSKYDSHTESGEIASVIIDTLKNFDYWERQYIARNADANAIEAEIAKLSEQRDKLLDDLRESLEVLDESEWELSETCRKRFRELRLKANRQQWLEKNETMGEVEVRG